MFLHRITGSYGAALAAGRARLLDGGLSRIGGASVPLHQSGKFALTDFEPVFFQFELLLRSSQRAFKI